MFNCLSKKKHTFYEMKNIKDLLKVNKKKISRKNENYISAKERPNWCTLQNKKRVPQFRCLCFSKNKRCPFFAFTNAEKVDYKFLAKRYHK